MALRIDPSLLDEAIKFYRDLLSKDLVVGDNPNKFPTNQEELAQAIQESSLRVGKMDSYSKKLADITKQYAKGDLRKLGEFGPMFTEAELENQKRIIATIRRQYEPVPKDSDPVGAAEGFVRMVGLASVQAASELRKLRGMPADPATGKFETDLDDEVAAESKELRNNPFFQRYIKDYPLTGDSVMVAFTGRAGLAVIPVREVLVHAAIAANDPTVRAHVKHWVNGDGDDEDLSKAFDAGIKAIEKATFSKEIQQRRFPVDLLATSALTSPAFLKMVGLPANLPQNLVLKAMNRVKTGALSLKDMTKNEVLESSINFFRDQRTVRAEKFMDTVTERVTEALGGGETAKEAAMMVQEAVKKDLADIATSAGKREEIGGRIFRSIYDSVRSNMAGLTQEEKVAVLYRVQRRPDLMAESFDLSVKRIKVFHGTDYPEELAKGIDPTYLTAFDKQAKLNPKDKIGFSVTTDQDVARKYGENIFEYFLDPNAKIAMPKDLPELKFTKFDDGEILFNQIDAIRLAKQKGFDGIDLNAFEKLTTDPNRNREIQIFNPSVLLKNKTPSSVYDSPRVARAASVIESQLKSAAAADAIHNPSPYWPAYKTFAEDMYDGFRAAMDSGAKMPPGMAGELLTKASGEFYKLERKATDVVTATAATIENRIDDLVMRLAAPVVNDVVTGSTSDANTVAALVMKNLEGVLDHPEQFRVVKQALAETNIGPMGPTTRAIKAYVNAAFLTTRAGAWTIIDSLDGVVSAATNVLKRAKSGEPISFTGLLQKTPVPRDVIEDVGPVFGKQSTHPWRWVAGLENFNNVFFKANKMVDNFRSTQIYKFNLGSEMKAISQETGIAVDQLPEASVKLATQRAIDSTKEFALTFSFNSALTTQWWAAAAFPYLGFYTKASTRLARNIGQVPELFKAGAYGLNKIREVNAEYPQDWQKESLVVKGFSFNLPRKLVSYPVLKTLADSYYGAPTKTDEYARMEREAVKLDKINDPVSRMQILDNNPELQTFINHRSAKSFGNFAQSLIDMQVLPLGPGITIPLRMADILSERTPHILPGGRQLTTLLTSVGLEKYDPESFLFPSVAAWNQETFDADVQTQMLIMQKNGTAKQFLDKGGSEALVNQARKVVRTRTFVDLMMNRLVGTGRQIIPQEQQLYNDLQRLRERADLLVPTDDEAAIIMQKTGVTNPELVDMIWKKSYMRTFEFDKRLREKREEILDETPELRPFEATFRSRRQNLNEQAALEDVRDRYDILRALPPDMKGAYAKTDRLLQAFAKSYNGTIKVDEDGNGQFEIKFDGDDVIGPTLYEWMTLNPQERLDRFKAGGPDTRIIQQFWPQLYRELNYQNPQPAHTITIEGQDPVLRQDKGPLTLLKLGVQPIEEALRAADSKALTDLFVDLHPERPLDFPQSVFQAYASRNPEQVKAFIEKGKKAGTRALQVFSKELGKVMSAITLTGNASAAEIEDRFGVQSDRVKNLQEMLEKPQTPDERAAVAEYRRRREDLSNFDLSKKDGFNGAIQYYRANVLPYKDLDEMFRIDPAGRKMWHMIGEPMKAGAADKFKDDFRGLVVGESLSNEYMVTKAELVSGLVEGVQDPGYFKQAKRKMQGLGEKGKTFWDALRFSWPSLTDEVDLRVKGHKYQLGFYSLPTFEPGQEAIRSRYFETFFSKPDETRLQWDARARTEIQKMDPTEFQRVVSFARDKGKSEVADAMIKVRQNQFVTLPLDRNSVRALDSAKDFILSNRDDTPLVYSFLRGDPELTTLMKNYDPRTYRTAESIVFHDTDQSYANYVKGTGYDAESLDYYRRHAPNSFNRVFDKDPVFRSIANSMGFERQATLADAAGTPSIVSNPEPIAPDPIPEGIFSNLPNTLNYIAKRARREASVIARVPQANRTDAEQQFIEAAPSAQVFQAFPGVIGQAFREGKLGPQEVISQFKGLADYGRATGAIGDRNYDEFTGFLANAATLSGATNFGFRLGQFLDDTFNTPRIPIQSRTLDFLLAGGPVSSGAPVAPGARLNLISPIETALVGSRRDPFPALGPAPIPGGQGEAALPPGPSRAEQATQGAAGATGAASVATIGIPPLAAIFAVVSAGFTIANMIQSSRSRSKARRDAQRQQEEQARRIREAQMAAEATQRESIASQLAEERVAQFMQEQRDQEQDFAQRSDRFLRSGASFATFASQPREFQNRFIDRFEPEMLQFTRRPQFESRLNLIQSIQGRLPRLRY